MADLFLDALQQETALRPGYRCGVARVLTAMPETHRSAVEAELDALRQARLGGTRHRHSCESLARLLTEYGYGIRAGVIQGHIAGRCACGR